MIREKNNLWLRFKRDKTTENRTKLKHIEAKLRRNILTAKRSSWDDFCNSINEESSIKDLWTKAKIILGSNKLNFKTTLEVNSSLIEDPKAIADIFAKKYSD